MIKLSNDELIKIVGGSISASLINSVVKALTIMIEVGRNLGSSISRVRNKNFCP